ncbi:hypothetical protein K491DRAFT_695661 [Lophiostoma macrostomum CBS 122681]|uniref:Ubiquitin interaction motif protein n=1 Tax=Lophiostoma macrostomum CBS 122681 TaxID=1314788 RepID=A0A6A6SXM1_9PLEO|nr:hypothetical protein K491DRAFT_695661 [Lophiostoma macrostomum CBS 122681]
MAADDENIDTLISSLAAALDQQLSREQAVKLLRMSDNNLDVAFNKVLDQGLAVLDETSWDESAFSSEDANLPTFNIDYAPGHDHYPHSGAGSVAPSRPPSRTSHHGDTPMQSIENGQETGLVGNAKPVFGPATRDYYDADRWAVVPTTTSAEYLPDAAAAQRKREDGSPAILKPLPSADYLPALLTILHSIPLCRNTFLTPEMTQTNYFPGEEWWKGNASPQPRTIVHGADTDADTVQDCDIIYETQRLMAFLDGTGRAYGSVGGLQQLDTVKHPRVPVASPDDELLKFLDSWAPAYQRQTSQPINGNMRSVVNVSGKDQEVWLLDASVIPNGTKDAVSLYDVLDDNLFDAATGRAHIKDISNVVILRLTNPRPGSVKLDCRFPATFYADRYLEKNKTVIDKILQERQQYANQLKELSTKELGLKYTTTKNVQPGKRVEVLQLLRTSMAAFKPRDDDLVEDPQDTAALSQLQAIYENVERKLKVLEEQKKKAQELVDNISSRFRPRFDDDKDVQQNGLDSRDGGQNTVESDNTNPPALLEHTHAYRLCGVSTRRGVYYLLDPDEKSDASMYKQWWRIEFSTATSDTYIFRERASLSDVLDKASSEHSSALLVYANDSALNTPTIPLSEPLQDFVNKDNAKFEEELQGGWSYGSDSNVEPLGGWNEVNAYSDNPPNYADDWAHYGGSSTSLPEKDGSANDTKSYNTSSLDTVFGTGGVKIAKRVQEPHYSEFNDVHNHNNEMNKRGDHDIPDSAMSSTTLTPNTEIEDEGVDLGGDGQAHATGTQGQSDSASASARQKPMEMQEVNGGVAAWAGLTEAPGGEAMEVEVQSGDGESRQTINMRDVEMVDVDLGDGRRVAHIENVEAKKGG